MDASLILSLRVLEFLHYPQCPECGEFGRHSHDGDCTRDGDNPGHGLLGDAPPFNGTGFTGFAQVMQARLEQDAHLLSATMVISGRLS